jgi:hypothetical protein
MIGTTLSLVIDTMIACIHAVAFRGGIGGCCPNEGEQGEKGLKMNFGWDWVEKWLSWLGFEGK